MNRVIKLDAAKMLLHTSSPLRSPGESVLVRILVKVQIGDDI